MRSVVMTCFVCVAWVGRSWASVETKEQCTDQQIPPQALSTALQAFAEVRGIELVYASDEIEGVQTRGVCTALAVEEALQRLLEGTGLTFHSLGDGAFTLLPIHANPDPADPPDPAALSASLGFGLQSLFQIAQRVAGFQSSADFAVSPESGPKPDVSLPAGVRASLGMEEVLVTGTNIRNVPHEFSPVTRVTRNQLDRAGYANVGQFIAQLPQNFGGGSAATPDRGAGSLSGIGANSVNLRAMGAGATLTLLNGRRMAPSGTAGSYVDISGIPTAALERVDVLTDGASAIYGSDAIAGVVNFILRKDYNGAETRVRVGTKTEGDANSYQIGQTFGVSNERGRALLSYEYSNEDPLDANDRSYTPMMDDPNDVLPGGYRNSAFFSGGLNLGSNAELFLDLNFSDRHSRQIANFNGSNRLTIADVKNYGATAGFSFSLPGDWRAEVSATGSLTDFRNMEYERPTREGFGGSDMWDEDSVWSVDAKADGGLFDLWGGTVRAVIGAQYREESHDGATDFFDEFGEYLNLVQLEADIDRSVSALYAEIYAPLVSEKNAVPGVRSLALSLAGRYEDYSDFGTTFNPKFGVLWSPIDGLTLRASYGKSFRAPPMFYLVDNINTVDIVDYIDPEVPSGRSVAAMVAGSSSDLDPEESTSWSFGFDLRPAFAPGFSARFTYYDIEYTGRIAWPSPNVDTNTYEFYDYPLPVERNVSLAQLESWVSQAQFPVFNYTTYFPWLSQSELEDVTVVLRGFYTNTSSSRAQGIDADFNYDFSVGESKLMATLNANYILEQEDQFSVLRAPVKTYDRIFNPAGLRMRGGMMWSLNAVSANLFANYVSSYDDDRVRGTTVGVDAWLTFDASVQYDFDRAGASGFMSGVKTTLSIRNLFDKDPSYVAPGIHVNDAAFAAYDTANADPDGRTIALQFTKQW